MEITNEVQTQLKLKELALLKSFINVCKTLDLHYYVAYGTLLGAVRHNGFIPWDDDVDIIMPRKEYETFLEKAQALLPEGIFLQTFETDKQYTNSYAKLRDNNTTFLETLYSDRHMNHGIFIDIFPLDYLPDNALMRKWILWRNHLQLLRQILFLNWTHSRHPLIKRIIQVFLCLLYPDSKKTLRKNQEMLRTIPPQKLMVNYCCCGVKANSRFPATCFAEGVKGIFEGIEVILPNDFDKCLTIQYGDYMTPPPKEKQVSNHDTIMIDPNKSYLSYSSLISSK